MVNEKLTRRDLSTLFLLNLKKILERNISWNQTLQINNYKQITICSVGRGTSRTSNNLNAYKFSACTTNDASQELQSSWVWSSITKSTSNSSQRSAHLLYSLHCLRCSSSHYEWSYTRDFAVIFENFRKFQHLCLLPKCPFSSPSMPRLCRHVGYTLSGEGLWIWVLPLCR